MSPSDPSLRLILNEVLPESLRQAIEEDARMQGMTLNDAAVIALAKKFRFRYRPTSNEYRPAAERFKLRVPWELHRRIRVEAARQPGGTLRGVALSVLAEHYGLDPISPERRPRRKAA